MTDKKGVKNDYMFCDDLIKAIDEIMNERPKLFERLSKI